MYFFAISNIIIYHTIIISNVANKIANYKKFRVVKVCLTYFQINRLLLLKYYFCFF